MFSAEIVYIVNGEEEVALGDEEAELLWPNTVGSSKLDTTTKAESEGSNMSANASKRSTGASGKLQEMSRARTHKVAI